MKQPLCWFIEIHWGEIEDFSELNDRLSFYWIVSLIRRKGRKDVNIF